MWYLLRQCGVKVNTGQLIGVGGVKVKGEYGKFIVKITI
jgi:hypothetical protein